MNQHPAEQDSTRLWARSTTSTADCRLVDDAIDEYSLGVAGSSQSVAIERHLVRCTRCSELVDVYQQTVVALALAVPLVAPPPSARTALLSRVAVTPQDVFQPAAVYAGDLESFRTATLPTSSPTFTASPSRVSADQSAWWRVYAAPLATLPLLLALGLVGAWGFNSYANLQDANAVIAEQDQSLANLNDQLDLDDQQVVRLAFSPSSKRYNMTSESSAQSGGSWGTLLADPITGQAALQVEGLDQGSYAVLVQTQDGVMVPKATFSVGASGTASTAVELGEQVTDFQSVHIRAINSYETDVALDGEIQDVLMAVIGPNINQSSGTGAGGR